MRRLSQISLSSVYEIAGACSTDVKGMGFNLKRLAAIRWRGRRVSLSHTYTISPNREAKLKSLAQLLGLEVARFRSFLITRGEFKNPPDLFSRKVAIYL